MSHGLTLLSVVGKARRQKWEVAGHIVSRVGKQRERGILVLSQISCFFSSVCFVLSAHSVPIGVVFLPQETFV